MQNSVAKKNGSDVPIMRNNGYPNNNVVQPLLTDLYQITMAYAYWKNGKMNDHAVFDLFFRKNPFCGEFTVFAGLEECVKFVQNFKFSSSDIDYLRRALPNVDEGFWKYLSKIDASQISLYAVPEGYVVFPKTPLIRVEGPLPVAQLLETTLLNLVNYASLVATNAARFRITAGDNVQLLEFGLRRAQGPDGGLSASKYCYVGGFDGTSNVLAGKLFGIPIRGTHAHAFVSSFKSLDELGDEIKTLKPHPNARPSKDLPDLKELSLQWLKRICQELKLLQNETNKGELAAFIAYGIAFPSTCLCLLDTYSVLQSGLPNFLAVALALNDYGYEALGVRLDSGDLAYLSKKCRKAFELASEKYSVPFFKKMKIVASNDINEHTLRSLKEQTQQIDSFGIGTHLVTCQKQPALGCVFKLVAVNDEPRMKLSEEVTKINLPGRKNAYRLYSRDDLAVLDLIQVATEDPPKAENKILVRHPLIESKRAYVTPYKVELLHRLFWGPNGVAQDLPSLQELKKRTAWSLSTLRLDIKRELNPTPYKVSVTDHMYNYLHKLWLQHVPIGELS